MPMNKLKPYIPEPKVKPTHFERLKDSVLMKNTPLEAGVFAVLSPLPMLFLAGFIGFIMMAAILYTLGPQVVGPWVVLLMILPLLASPVLGILSIVNGFRKIKEKRAWTGIALGVLCLLENAALFFFGAYLSQF